MSELIIAICIPPDEFHIQHYLKKIHEIIRSNEQPKILVFSGKGYEGWEHILYNQLLQNGIYCPAYQEFQSMNMIERFLMVRKALIGSTHYMTHSIWNEIQSYYEQESIPMRTSIPFLNKIHIIVSDCCIPRIQCILEQIHFEFSGIEVVLDPIPSLPHEIIMEKEVTGENILECNYIKLIHFYTENNILSQSPWIQEEETIQEVIQTPTLLVQDFIEEEEAPFQNYIQNPFKEEDSTFQIDTFLNIGNDT